jgi:hypothetical protein
VRAESVFYPGGMDTAILTASMLFSSIGCAAVPLNAAAQATLSVTSSIPSGWRKRVRRQAPGTAAFLELAVPNFAGTNLNGVALEHSPQVLLCPRPLGTRPRPPASPQPSARCR